MVLSHEGGEACVCDLTAAFDLSQPTISHHLKVLHEAGLLDREKRGVWVYYQARPEAMEAMAHPVRHGRGGGPRVSDTVHETPHGPEDAAVLQRLSTLDRFLPSVIGLAMALGLLLGRLIPGLDDALSRVEVGSVSLPIAIGLLVMMYPVLAKVRYDEIGHVTADRTLLVASIVLNWVVGPALMFALAWLLLPDLPAVPHRPDHRGPRPVHRHGADLERPRLR